jgi:outer membrane protein assembly factor BamD
MARGRAPHINVGLIRPESAVACHQSTGTGVFRTLSLVAALALAACAGDARGPAAAGAQPDSYLFERGSKALEAQDWLEAREYFRQIVDGYPQSPHRADAKLGIGDSLLGEGTTEARTLAIAEFREFLTFFPTHSRADYAQYKLAMAYFYQMRGPERDQTPTKDAVREFQGFVDRYPNSTLMAEVKPRMREAKDRLSESDYRVGLFYYRSRWYPGAIDRFKELLRTDPEYTHRDAVYFHLAEALVESGKEAEALPYYERLLMEFEQSEYLQEASERIGKLKTSPS